MTIDNMTEFCASSCPFVKNYVCLSLDKNEKCPVDYYIIWCNKKESRKLAAERRKSVATKRSVIK